MDFLLNTFLPILIPIVIIGWWAVMIRQHARRGGFGFRQYNPRMEWYTSAGLGVMTLFMAIVLWAYPEATQAPIFEVGSPWEQLAIILVVVAWHIIYVKKVRKMSWAESFLNVGVKARDEREAHMILQATQLAFAVTLMLLVGLYTASLFASMPSRASFVLILVTVLFFARAAFSYKLDRLGFPAQSGK